MIMTFIHILRKINTCMHTETRICNYGNTTTYKYHKYEHIINNWKMNWDKITSQFINFSPVYGQNQYLYITVRIQPFFVCIYTCLRVRHNIDRYTQCLETSSVPPPRSEEVSRCCQLPIFSANYCYVLRYFPRDNCISCVYFFYSKN